MIFGISERDIHPQSPLMLWCLATGFGLIIALKRFHERSQERWRGMSVHFSS